MADNTESNAGNAAQKSEQLLKLVKRRFENWRELLIHTHEILIWEKPYYPGITAGSVTLTFLMLWYFDPSVLTALSTFGIIACIMDYFVPILSASLFDPNKWTGTQERKYEEICRMIIGGYMSLEQMCHSVHQIKETKPYLYVIGIVGFLAFTAWIGNLINNLFLTYLMVLLALLAPGIKSQKVVQNALDSIQAMIGQSKKKK